MKITRDFYIQKLIDRKNNGMIKIITGLRRCGKSYLLFDLFVDYLLEQGVQENHIIAISLDDRKNIKLRDPDELYRYVSAKIIDSDMYYILLDEIQFVDEFEDVLNGFLHIKNADTYVTGSNARFLSKDIITEFRGRGDQVHLYPLSFSEYMSAYAGTVEDGLRDYMVFGGMPYLFNCKTNSQKREYLNALFSETYLVDIIERNRIKNKAVLDDLLNIISSDIGSLTNPNKLVNTFKTEKKVCVAANTIKEYLDVLEEAFVIDKAYRYDVKGKKYIETPLKYYFTDIGLRNARIGFRQDEETHIMENVIFNEMKIRGYSVDVGNVVISEPNKNGNYVRKNTEVDFVCNDGINRTYIQAALNVASAEKLAQETRSLKAIGDSFEKIIVVKENVVPWRTEDGILVLGIRDFLLNPSMNY